MRVVHHMQEVCRKQIKAVVLLIDSAECMCALSWKQETLCTPS